MRKIFIIIFSIFLFAQAADAAALSIGTRIHTIVSAADLRDSAGGNQIGTKRPDDRGVIIGGPVLSGGIEWWQINFDQTANGWVKGGEIEEVPASRFFAKDSTWYTPIPANPTIVQNSANYINDIILNGPAISENNREWSVPIWYARSDTSYVTVNILGLNPASAGMGWNRIPIPNEALPPGNSGTGYFDGHMVVISADHKFAWTLYQAKKDTSTGAWRAASVRKWDLTKDGVISPYDHLTEQRLVPVPLLQGLVTYEEIKRGYIDHALAFAYQGIKSGDHWFYYPAEFYNSGDNPRTWALLGGERIQLDPSIDCNSFTSWTEAQKIVCRALQQYGMILVDSTGPGSNVFYAEQLGDNEASVNANNGKPIKWGSTFGNDFSGLDLRNLRIVQQPRVNQNAIKVQAKQNVNLYDSPFNTANSIQIIFSGSQGVISSPDDPVTVNGVDYRFVNFDTNDADQSQHNHGWVRADLLNVIQTPSPTPTPAPALAGDLNNDRIVNSLDWSLMSSKWLTSDATADLNKDGTVNTLDWSIMSANWLKTN